MSQPTIACPHCRADLTPAEVLDAATVALPSESAVEVTCPRCRATAWARLGAGTVALGPQGHDAALLAVVRAPELSVRPDASWIDCWYAGRYRRYPARRSARVA